MTLPLRLVLLLVDEGEETPTLPPCWMVRNNMRGPGGEVFLGPPIFLVVSEEQYQVFRNIFYLAKEEPVRQIPQLTAGWIEGQECQNNCIMLE